jgi:hypothetical protein
MNIQKTAAIITAIGETPVPRAAEKRLDRLPHNRVRQKSGPLYV